MYSLAMALSENDAELMMPIGLRLDVNFRKNFRYGHGKTHTFQFDIFNVFNSNAIRTMTDSVGTSLGQVTAILPGRFPRIAYQFKW